MALAAAAKRSAVLVVSVRESGNNHDSFSHRIFVGKGNVNSSLEAFRYQSREMARRAPSQSQRGPPGKRIDDTDVSEVDPSTKTGSERFRSSLFRGEALRESPSGMGAGKRFAAFFGRENAV
jgi:hypothetical protein